jgi:hypothetical protein
MKIFWIVLGIVALALVVAGLINYFLQRRRQKLADTQGVVVYATVLSVDDAGGLAKHAQLKKIALRVQEPGETTGREVTIRTRIAPNQKFAPGMKVAVAIDPKNPKRVYPASPEAAKRVVLTGSRLERRQMRAQGFNRQQPPAPRYQPPIKTGRR